MAPTLLRGRGAVSWERRRRRGGRGGAERRPARRPRRRPCPRPVRDRVVRSVGTGAAPRPDRGLDLGLCLDLPLPRPRSLPPRSCPSGDAPGTWFSGGCNTFGSTSSCGPGDRFERVDGANGEVEFFLRAPAPRRHVLRRRRQRAVPPSWGDDPRRLRLFVIDAPIDHLGKPNRHATRSALLRRDRRIDALGRVVDGLERLRVRRAHPPERRQSRGRRGCREGAVAPDVPFNDGGGGAFPVGTFLGVLAVHRLGRAVVAARHQPVEESIRRSSPGGRRCTPRGCRARS